MWLLTRGTWTPACGCCPRELTPTSGSAPCHAFCGTGANVQAVTLHYCKNMRKQNSTDIVILQKKNTFENEERTRTCVFMNARKFVEKIGIEKTKNDGFERSLKLSLVHNDSIDISHTCLICAISLHWNRFQADSRTNLIRAIWRQFGSTGTAFKLPPVNI